jgi:hypothetical protein
MPKRSPSGPATMAPWPVARGISDAMKERGLRSP